MKILELRFKNLNSLYGEWCIDFTNPEYVSNGVFALTGPTGAGKSTILDAICLALYGATPRLGKITKSSNEIMSRQTGECYAEVLFTSQAGRFRCHWEQRRARKKAEGNLQEQEHQIIDADSGKPIETKKSLVTAIIEEKTGMDFERFTRSVLLAQGGFDTFLKAGTEQKSKILEQITGTEIYSVISRRVHERQRDEREKLNILTAETAGIIILEPEQEKEIEAALASKQKEETKLSIHASEISKAINWLTTLDNLNQEISDLATEAAELQAKIEAFKPERVKLEQALKATLLGGTYAATTALRQQQTDDETDLKKTEATLPTLKITAKTQAEALSTAEQLTFKSKEALRTATPLLQKVRFLDQEISEQNKAISESSAACTREAAKIEESNQAIDIEIKKQKNAEGILKVAERYLKDNAHDEWLLTGLAGIEAQFSNLLIKQQEITQQTSDCQKAHTAVVKATKNREAATKQCALKKQALKSATKNVQRSKNSLNELLGDKLLREYRTEKETLLREMTFIRKIEALEAYRTKLEDGKPCPLCGATKHPFAEGNIPRPDEIEQKIAVLSKQIDAAEVLEDSIKKRERAEIVARDHLNHSEKLEAEATHNQAVADNTLIQLKDDLAKYQADFIQLKLTVFEKLKPLGIKEMPETKLETLLKTLQSRLKAWQQQVAQKINIEKQLATIESETKRLHAIIDTQHKVLAEKQEKCEQHKQALSATTKTRTQAYGDKQPNEEEKRLNQAITQAEKSEKKARDLNIKLQQQWTMVKTHIASLKKRIEQRTPKWEKAEIDFTTALITKGFADEDAFLAAKLTDEERVALSTQAQALDNAITTLQAKQKDREKRLATERAKKHSDKPIEALQLQSQALEDTLKNLRDTSAELKHKLHENTVAKERIKEKQSTIEAQKKECARFEMLHALIGSADGKKYRNFAQGLTFELMIAHANRQLEKMTDRYLLILDEQQPLALNVVDNYQAGEIRSTQNLSGGESFIVSLTLALGLSKMASQKVQVDSLFLDEGFGTLDEETLETALDTLSSLQQDGKIIGVISHVAALKERISTQINITPVSGGRSTLSGPGCLRKS